MGVRVRGTLERGRKRPPLHTRQNAWVARMPDEPQHPAMLLPHATPLPTFTSLQPHTQVELVPLEEGLLEEITFTCGGRHAVLALRSQVRVGERKG